MDQLQTRLRAGCILSYPPSSSCPEEHAHVAVLRVGEGGELYFSLPWLDRPFLWPSPHNPHRLTAKGLVDCAGRQVEWFGHAKCWPLAALFLLRDFRFPDDIGVVDVERFFSVNPESYYQDAYHAVSAIAADQGTIPEARLDRLYQFLRERWPPEEWPVVMAGYLTMDGILSSCSPRVAA